MFPVELCDSIVQVCKVGGRFPHVFFLRAPDLFHQVDKLVTDALAV